MWPENDMSVGKQRTLTYTLTLVQYVLYRGLQNAYSNINIRNKAGIV